jgi:EAL domain-containing protein (putative c-di-GMP-specific phosphodiesterase class I)
MSPTLLTDAGLPDRLERLLRKHEVDNKQLIVEVTENVAMQYTRATTEVLGRLRFKKFGLAIDDFGAGYFSLEQLYRMPFDELKIDGSFIKCSETNKDIRVIIEAIVMLGQKLGMTVCAEGVETVEAFDFLASTGCDKQQGFLIGRPVPASELEPPLNRPKGAATPIRAIA